MELSLPCMDVWMPPGLRDLGRCVCVCVFPRQCLFLNGELCRFGLWKVVGVDGWMDGAFFIRRL